MAALRRRGPDDDPLVGAHAVTRLISTPKLGWSFRIVSVPVETAIERSFRAAPDDAAHSWGCQGGACTRRRSRTSDAVRKSSAPHGNARGVGTVGSAVVEVGVDVEGVEGIVGKVVGLSHLRLELRILDIAAQLRLRLEAPDEEVPDGIGERSLLDHIQRLLDLLPDT